MKIMLKQFENHPDFSGILCTVREEYRQQGAFFLEETYLRELHARLELFPRSIDAICRDAAAIRREPEKAVYALFVVRAMAQRELFKRNLSLFDFPTGEHPFFAMLCLIPAITAIHEFLVARQLPEDVIRATLGQFEACTFIYRKRFDHLGLNKRYFDWLQHYVDFEIINIERLRFEILTLSDPVYLLRRYQDGTCRLLFGNGEMNCHGLYADTPPVESAAFRASVRETETCWEGTPVSAQGRCLPGTVCLSKEEYGLVARSGDTVLSVHIPDEGDFSRESCLRSYQRAREIFARCFPELTIRAFHCHSWMMAPELGAILKPDSRILSFAEPYLRYPIPTQGDDVLNFVFLLKFTTYEDLPEDTSLQRALKQRYLRGEYLYEYGGIFPV